MKRSGRQFENLDQWWSAYRPSHEPEDVATLGADLEPLLDNYRDPEPVPGLRSNKHLVQTLSILEELKVDAATLAATCRHHLAKVQRAGVARTDAVGGLVSQLEEIDALEAAYDPEQAAGNPEGLRRLLLALVKDVRALLIALADRTVGLRALTDASGGDQLQFARRVSAIHAPLANRLGIWHLKWELEDLCFRWLQPEIYKRIGGLLDERRADRERYIDEVVGVIRRELGEANIEADVRGRPKHIFSIWRKMQRKNLPFEQLYDVRAVRVLVEDVRACYSALGILHSMWHPIPGEFDDYIANPKPNGYRSLHTVVFGPEGKTIEIQVRTREMHEQAELGVAAHWRYKEGGSHDPVFQRKLNAMRQLLASPGDDELLEDFGEEVDDERVYVLTPRGEVIEMRAGSTVLDFAYHVHTDVGHRCKGAKVNGRIVPLTYALNNGQQVEILTGKEPDPSRDWMIPSLGYLKTPRARAKVRQWFKRADLEQNVADGRELLDKELKRLGVSQTDLRRVVQRFGKRDLDGLYAAVGVGEITPGQVANALQSDSRDAADDTALKTTPPRRTSAGGEVLIEGVGNLLTVLAKCCSPVPGDRIVGFLTRTRGVSIHREDCRSVARLIGENSSRLLEVEWSAGEKSHYQAEVALTAYDRPGLVRDIGNLLMSSRIDLLGINSKVDPTTGQVAVQLAVRVSDFEQLSNVLNRLGSLPNVFEARRVG